ncbi:ExeM/NucH family extracellular endonuclease [Marinibactrum halimedae]|uniref:Endonuclease/exonuclease/phosphatase domain-containing protein n=1 Tax=Marinibactrum halimedae TaxID=1444977 RepID=A0AA37WP90_9GAMM|nr:ExeM/NucH family extracellular endonuclease [Marinibactrum halimedae]MCD9460476.1 ExeM/NucH family extracellular endonuclease [Marinibactrum halimedae]GLS25882.1 hypothetical protein GCM10007877_15960 [Marinibactrum halimedae]
MNKWLFTAPLLATSIAANAGSPLWSALAQWKHSIYSSHAKTSESAGFYENSPSGIGHCFFSPSTGIHDIQGSGSEVNFAGESVVVEGVVTAIRDGGFFVQEEIWDTDRSRDTSEGIFVSSDDSAVYVGQSVRVQGTPEERFGNSQLVAEEIADCGRYAFSVRVAQIPMPYEGKMDLESVEGMLVRVTNATVYSLDNFTRHGEIFLSDGVKWTPTDVGAPFSEEYEKAVANINANILYVEDNTSASFPDTISYYATDDFDGLDYANAPSIGDTVTAIGPLNYAFGAYRINTRKDWFDIKSSREESPQVKSGDVSIASFNVLNYFNGEYLENGEVTFDYESNRGAFNAEQFALQKSRIVDAIISLDADIIGLMEVENDGFGGQSSIADLVNALNVSLDADVYAYATPEDDSITGGDAITNAIVYRKDVVELDGQLQAIEMPRQVVDDIFAAMRPSLVQSFKHTDTGESLAVVVNHFKSKGGGCIEDIEPTDQDDIQGSCNALRVSASVALAEGLKALDLPEKQVLLGDFNSYSAEDPMAVLTTFNAEERGYTINTAEQTFLNEGQSIEVSEGYGFLPVAKDFDEDSFSYYYFRSDQVGSLDHVLVSPATEENVVDVAHWNINSTEMFQLQYNQALRFYNGPEGASIDFTQSGPYRSSDHDPVIIVLDLDSDGDDD